MKKKDAESLVERFVDEWCDRENPDGYSESVLQQCLACLLRAYPGFLSRFRAGRTVRVDKRALVQEWISARMRDRERSRL